MPEPVIVIELSGESARPPGTAPPVAAPLLLYCQVTPLCCLVASPTVLVRV